MRGRYALLAVLAGASLPFSAWATLEDAGDIEVRFLAKGPGGLSIHGSAPDLKASEAGGKLTIRVPVTDLKTGIKLRDRHLKRYLEVDKYPESKLVVERSKLSFPENDKTVQSSATGDFTLHGKTKAVTFSYQALRTGSDYHVQGLATIDIRDYDVEVPCYLGVCVDPKVKLKVKLKLRDK